MRTLSIDIETYSDVDLSKCGVYKYASSPAFEILLFGYAAGKLCQRLLTRNYISMLILTAFECVLLGLLRYLFSLMHAGASFLIVLRQLAVGTVLTCLFCFIVYLPLRRLSGKSRKRSR